MGIPLDIEDIFGAGCISSVVRAFSMLGCLWLGSATGSLAFGGAETVMELSRGISLDFGKIAGEALVRMAVGPLLLFGWVLLPLFFPLVIYAYFVLGRGDGGSGKVWLGLAGITGLLVLVTLLFADSPAAMMSVLAFVFWAGLMGSLGMMASLFVQWQLRSQNQHLLAVAAENEERRRRLSEAYGTAVGDREFATGESQVLPESDLPDRRDA